MKALHLMLASIFTFTLCLSVLSDDVFATAEKKEVAAPVTVEKATAPVKTAKDEKSGARKVNNTIPSNVNINSASKEELTLLPGIGPVTAEAILAYRKDNGKFSSIDELTKVKGIGDKTLAKLKPYLQAM